jgi:hypothetical protein
MARTVSSISPTDKPDWGHGPNQPVKMYTEAQIRQVMEEHDVNAFIGEEECADYECGSRACRGTYATPNADHIINELRKL